MFKSTARDLRNVKMWRMFIRLVLKNLNFSLLFKTIFLTTSAFRRLKESTPNSVKKS